MLKKLFGYNPEKTTVKTEIFAGITSFLTMSYILAVNPSLFGQLDGMPQSAVFTATALVAVISTLLVAFLAKMPFGIAPGMGPNAFFVFTVCLGMGYSWQFALTAILIEGIILLLLSVTRLREALVNLLPETIKYSITIGIGLFITFVGMQNAGIIIMDASTLVQLGEITQGSPLLALIGLIITAALVVRKVPGGMLIGILITTIIGIPMGITHFHGLVDIPQSVAPIFFQFEWDKILTTDMLVVVLSFLFIDLFSLTGSAVGVCLEAGYADKQGRISGIGRLFMADSIGTISSSLLGTSSACTYIESTSGVAQGGKSGLTAFTIAICFAAALFFAPFFLAVPHAATGPVLIIVGIMMFSSVKNLPLNDLSESLPAFVTIVVMPLAYSIADGILLGVISYVLIKLVCGKYKDLNLGLCILAVIFILKYIFL